MANRRLHAMTELDATRAAAHQFAWQDAVMQKFTPTLQADDASGDNVVNIMGIIGWPEWAGGIDAKAVQERLSQIGDGDIVVNINSPGGDFFEGQAIHNLLRMHKGQVEVRVIGIAASAASVIAMAGDKITIPKTGWIMIHNVWTIAMGDKNALKPILADLETFDQVSADLYSERSGHPFREVVKMMDDETTFAGERAVEMGFADEILAVEKVKSGGKQSIATNALQLLEQSSKKGGLSRSQFRAAMAQLRPGKPRATDEGTPSAADTTGLSAGLRELKQNLADLATIKFEKD